MKHKIIAGIVAGAIVGAVVGYFGNCAGGVCRLTVNPIMAVVIWAAIGGLLASFMGGRSKHPSSTERDNSGDDTATGGNASEKK